MWKFQFESKNILIKILHDLEGQQIKAQRTWKMRNRNLKCSKIRDYFSNFLKLNFILVLTAKATIEWET